MDDYKKLVDRLRDEPKDSRKASLSILDLCVEAAAEIENLEGMLKESEAARAELGKHLAATQKELHEAKSELLKYREAEQDGRLVVLPCKVGDTIYYTRAGWPVVEHIKVRTFFVGDPTRRGEILHLHMIRTDKFDVSMDALGKTVFLPREEAEAALAQEGGTHEADSV